MSAPLSVHPASFRDPAGFMYKYKGELFRFVHSSYKEHYELLFHSGLFKQLTDAGWMIQTEEAESVHLASENHFRTLKPAFIPYLSYPGEWSFTQYKDAALLTLKICEAALEKGMILKDATPLNIQFYQGKACWIDHLSFERYEEGAPWIAYNQFCESFLNPLLIAYYKSIEIHRLYTSYPSGISASLTARLLPFISKFKLAVALHVHLNARVQSKTSRKNSTSTKRISKKNLFALLSNLLQCIGSLEWKKHPTEWSDYYDSGILNEKYLSSKKKIIGDLLTELNYNSLLDLGANDGTFSFLANKNVQVIASDQDSSCIDRLYTKTKSQGLKNILPVVIDLMHPSPASGWMNTEQPSFVERMKTDLCLALALIHHLCIGKNLPFSHAVQLFAASCDWLLIEFIPKSDPKATLLLQNRSDHFHWYNQEAFELAFSDYFTIHKKFLVEGSERTIYVMQKHRKL
jgi:ribosomal protein L11 methylase PrmA